MCNCPDIRISIVDDDIPVFLHVCDDDEPVHIKIIDETAYMLSPYDGQTMITPTEDEQVLLTMDKFVTENIVIGPIPRNYGKVSYNGVSLTVE